MMKRVSWQPPKWVRVVIPTVLIATWFAVAGVGGPYFGRVEEVSDVDLSAFLPKSAEATKVNEEVKSFALKQPYQRLSSSRHAMA